MVSRDKLAVFFILEILRLGGGDESLWMILKKELMILHFNYNHLLNL